MTAHLPRVTKWTVAGWRLGCGDYGTTWRMRMRDRIKAWFHRHVCADDATSDRLDAVDQDIRRREIAARLGELETLGILHGTGEKEAGR
jgi:phage tail sheath gpL-like